MGGTSESVAIASALAQAGYPVLVSMATEVPLAMQDLPGIRFRRGRLNQHELELLLRQQSIAAVVDATHPFALQAHETAATAAKSAGIPYWCWQRPPSDLSDFHNLHFAADHREAAQLAVQFARPILLTIGSKNLAPYVAEARHHGLPLYARLLPCEEARHACHVAELDRENVIFARGPFSVEDTLRLLLQHHIGVLVTKESGMAGGVPEKLQACAQACVACVVVRRTDRLPAEGGSSISGLFEWLASQGLPSKPTNSHANFWSSEDEPKRINEQQLFMGA